MAATNPGIIRLEEGWRDEIKARVSLNNVERNWPLCKNAMLP